MNDLMIDLETLGTGPTAMILAIGAVRFDLVSGKIDDNPLMDTRVEQQYLRSAIDAILDGLPAVSTQPALGCNIKQ